MDKRIEEIMDTLKSPTGDEPTTELLARTSDRMALAAQGDEARRPTRVRRVWLSAGGIAAAGVLVLAGWALHSAGRGLEAPAFADVIARALQAETVSFVLHEHWGTAQVLVQRPNLQRMEFGTGGYAVADRAAGRCMRVRPQDSEVTYEAPSEGFAYDLYGWFAALRDARGAERVGERRFDGRMCVGYEATAPVPASEGGVNTQYLVWADPESGLPVQISDLTKSIKKKSDIRFGAPIDPRLFDLKPPAGYTVRTKPAPVSEDNEAVPEVTEGEPADGADVHAVNRRIGDYPDEEDYSTPEKAFVTITNRAMLVGTNAAWRRVSAKSLRAAMPDDDRSQYKVRESQRKEWLDTEILEVRVYGGKCAAVISRFPGPRGNIDLRSLVLEDGEWRNTGEDICPNVAAAREKAARVCQKGLERDVER